MITRMQQELKALKARVPKKRKPLILKLDAIDKASMDVLELVDATKTFEGLERPILDNQTLEVRKGDRIGIVGGNGQGKTTLLKIINEELKLDSGKIDVSPGTVIGYFHQDHATLDFELNPVEQIQKLRPDYQYGDIVLLWDASSSQATKLEPNSSNFLVESVLVLPCSNSARGQQPLVDGRADQPLGYGIQRNA